MINFLIEVGCEPIPPQYVKSATDQLRTGILKVLGDNRIEFSDLQLYYTSRRLGVFIRNLPKKQQDLKTEIQGPPETQAFDPGKKPTKILKGFLKSKGLSLKDVSVRKTKKGRYVFVTINVMGKNLKDILSGNVPDVLQGIEFPKTMVWNGSRASFIRPIRWICAILGNQTCPIHYAGIKSSKKTRGSLTAINQQIAISNADSYKQILKRYGIIVDPEERRKKIKVEIEGKAKSLNVKPIIDDDFLDRITNMVEQPEIAFGSFSKQFLDLPRPVLERAIRDILYCIPLEKNHKLINRYIIILDAKKQAIKKAERGYDQVIKASLSDARFYFENDLKIGLERMVEMENDVVWLEGKGTLKEKTDRLIKITSWIGAKMALDQKPIKRAARLSKADLTSNLIREKDFTPLQGIAGSFYAEKLGEEKEVYEAIGEQYLPRFIGDQLPGTIFGSVLSIADRYDNISAAFAAGKVPTGSQDPLGIRKQAYGAIQIMVKQKYPISISDLIGFMKNFYSENKDKDLSDFFTERLKHYLLDQKISYDIVNAVTAVCLNPYDAVLRCKTLADLRTKKEFEILVIGQKRLTNILKGVKKTGKPDPQLFEDTMETKLFDLAVMTEKEISGPLLNKDYPKVINSLLNMRNTIDKFFDEVLVMHENEKIRNNRLALVKYVRNIFNKFADFSKIVIAVVGDAQG